jgi:hypothetical protein
MLHFCVTFFAGSYIFYDGNKIYFYFQQSFLSIGYENIFFQLNHSFTTASTASTASTVWLSIIELLIYFFLPKRLRIKHKLFVFKLNTGSQCLTNTIFLKTIEPRILCLNQMYFSYSEVQ